MLKIIKHLNRFSTIRQKIKRQRETRLGKTVSETVLPTKSIDQIEKIRNVGIIAHIDAGKTTTTERMLYYAGALPSPGDIDEGTTTMDYMKQQRERGITIRSAAISFNWKKIQVNLIDTPGHVDFSGEVARSLKVLDGAVTILDGVKGVEAQTIKVWEQARKRNIPRICYVNKMDRIGASVLQTAEAIQKRLNVYPLLMQLPLGEADLFKGVIDIARMEEVHFGGRFGELMQRKKVTKEHPKFQQIQKYRQTLIEMIGNHDDQIGQMYINQQQVTGLKIKQALKKLMQRQNEHNLCPIYLGTSFKNKGVQPLLDAIIQLLPSPKQKDAVHDVEDFNEVRRPSKDEPLSAYVFKILYDLEMGPLAYTRIYSGEMKKSTNLLNTSKSSNEKISHLFRVRANQYVPIQQASAGDIVAISGFRDTKAGETLIQYGQQKFLLENLELPSAIFTVPFQVESNKYLPAFKESIEKATIEDNSLLYQFEPQTGQYLVSGLGQLHLQILRDKMISQKIPVRMGNLKINYKQTISASLRDSLKIRKEVKPGIFEQFQIEIQVVPLRTEDDKVQKKNSIVFDFERVKEFDDHWREFLRRKHSLSQHRRSQEEGQDQTQENFVKVSRKSIRNPTPVQPIQEEFEDQDDEEENYVETLKDEQSNEAMYHISTLPFETLFELYETCRVNLMYGKKNFPMTGVQIRVHNGIYTKSTFTKGILNRCTTELLRSLINSTAILLEPFMEFTLTGEQAMIDIAVKDVLSKRGMVQIQELNTISGKIPASSVRGWVKELRAMGLEIEMKFADYEEVTGIDPEKLLEQN